MELVGGEAAAEPVRLAEGQQLLSQHSSCCWSCCCCDSSFFLMTWRVEQWWCRQSMRWWLDAKTWYAYPRNLTLPACH
ncbi:hypothetical protein HanRHA438_Chr09g0389661 [Helianthus annuus]|nr:hypothetical protein HanRHA438_Chr09g0389661 [Helianthus annuus]